jgi:hypothetical protein
VTKTEERSHGRRRGRDFLGAPRCGAKTRRGTSCQRPAMTNGRCRLHGGLSTGPKTPEGVERIRRSRTKHGRYSEATVTAQRRVHALVKESRALLATLALGPAE